MQPLLERKLRPGVSCHGEFKLYVVLGNVFVEKDALNIPRGAPYASKSQRQTSGENSTNRKHNKEDRLSRRQKSSFGVTFVDHRWVIRDNCCHKTSL